MAELSFEDIRRATTTAISGAQPLNDLRNGLQALRNEVSNLREKQNQIINAERCLLEMHQMMQRFAASVQNGQTVVNYMQQTSANMNYLQQRLASMEQYAAVMSEYMSSLQKQLNNIEILQHQLVLQSQASARSMAL